MLEESPFLNNGFMQTILFQADSLKYTQDKKTSNVFSHLNSLPGCDKFNNNGS